LKRSAVAVGFVELAHKLAGPWPGGTPERVQIYGRTFVHSRRWAFPYAGGVVAQYREDVDRNSMHLKVFDDGHFEIDHVDAANPERGHVLAHAMQDVSGTKLGGVVVGLGVTALAAALAWAVSRLHR
jgi:hypothetical protein